MKWRQAGVAALALAVVACTAVKEEDDPAVPVTVPGETGAPAPVPGEPETPTTRADVGNLAEAEVRLTEIARMQAPVGMAVREGDPSIYIAEQAGRVRRIEVTTRTNGAQQFTVDRTATLDISRSVVSGGEQGLLGITFSSDGNRLYVAYTGEDEQQHLDEYQMSAERAVTSSRRELLVVRDFAPNHNGGQLAFGPDGFLYWAMGDGGGGGDPESTGQDPSDLLGSILRIDPDIPPEGAPTPYLVPEGNPFVDGGGAPEVWVWGLRNPWRFSFDRVTGDLWIADVGQGDVEEIDFLPAGDGSAGRGANLGWADAEGDRPFDGRSPAADAIPPVFAYDHSGGRCSVTGGFVYRGERIPDLVGAYLFADYCDGDLRALVLDGDGAVALERSLGVTVENPTSFGQDNDGELYVLSAAGPISRIIAG